MEPQEVEALQRRYLIRNFTFIAADGALFGTGVALVGVQTLVPAILARLGASNAMIGLLPALLTLGSMLPPLFTAYLVTGKTRTKRYSLLIGVSQRIPWLVAGATLYLAGGSRPALVVGVFLAAIVVFGVSNGLVGPIWFDLVTRAVPGSMRGRMFAIRDTVSQGLTLAGGAYAAWLLASGVFPEAHALLLLSGFGVFTVSWFCFAATREVPAVKPVARVPIRDFLGRFPSILRAEQPFRRFVIARGLFIIANASAPFATVFVLSEFNLPDSYVGAFTITTAATVVVFTMLFGALGDSRGHRQNFVYASIALVAAGALAMTMQTRWIGLGLFVMFGIANSAMSISGFNLVAEFCRPDEIALYIAVASVVTAPLSLASVVLGILADALGFRWVFVAGSGLAVIALVLFVSIGDTRHAHHKTR